MKLLESGALPVEDLAALAWREGLRPRPVYQAHRWFARRFGSAFRALLTAAALPADSDFWDGYYENTDWTGKVVLDPFVGGGTAIIEASRLGAHIMGVDVDAVACAITRFEAAAAETPDLIPTLERLKQQVGSRLQTYYRATDETGATLDVLHYFWVQIVSCAGCGAEVEAHPHYQLAYDAEGTQQWVFCPSCHAVQALDRAEAQLTCPACTRTTPIAEGTVRFGRLTCPRCGTRERLIDVAARTGRPPDWRLFALEYLEVPAPAAGRPLPLRQRSFRAASAQDVATLEAATAALQERTTGAGAIPWVPDRLIPADGRFDDRLPRYGYRRYRELFNARQLLHLSLLGQAVDALTGPERDAFALAFSDHLTTNCMMTAYAFGWRRASPLFSVRAFRHITRPVEVNPWLDGTGRGTFPNAVRQVQRAIDFARQPHEPVLAGGFRTVSMPRAGQQARVYHRNAQALDFIPDESVDLVLTDPPYFDNIAYSELSDFFLPWLQMFGLACPDGQGPVALTENIAAKGRDSEAAEAFADGLGRCFAEIARVLKRDGRVVFTFQHHTAGAWLALARALAGTKLHPLQVFPLFGDTRNSLHTHQGSIRWDAVFVLVPDDVSGQRALSLSCEDMEQAYRHCMAWTARLQERLSDLFRPADTQNLLRASLVGASLGLFPTEAPATPGRPLADVLADDVVSAMLQSGGPH